MSISIFEGRGVGPLGLLCRGLVCLALGLLVGVSSAQAGDPVRIDLNRASAAELEALPGVGAVKAAAIVAEREASGGFQSVDELESVRGIGPALIAKLRPLVTVGSRTASAEEPSAGQSMKSGDGGANPTRGEEGR
jgi:competence ComEA-like helix-hairpin-helix protein